MNKVKGLHIKAIFVYLALILLMSQMSFAQNETKGQKKSFFSELFKKKSNKERKYSDTETITLKQEPVMSIDKLFFDYGDVVQGESAVAEFEISNLGGINLSIKDIEISCNCVDINLSYHTIKPNGKAVLKLTYNTNIVGEIKRSVTLVSNDKSNERTTLLLTGNVKVKN